MSENPVSDLLLAGVREISLFIKPVTVEQAFIDGLGVMDIWIDVPIETQDRELVKLLHNLRRYLVSSYLEFSPEYDCSLVATRAGSLFGAVQLEHGEPLKATVLIDGEPHSLESA